MLDADLRMQITEHLDAAARELAAVRALLVPSLDDQIIATIRAADCPLTMQEIVRKTGGDYSAIGMRLTLMYQAGTLTRGRIRRDKTQRRYYAYEVKK